MSSEAKKSLFFLKSPKHNLSSIENFLNRREFTVKSTSDYKVAVGEVIPLNPDYIFLAWDHPMDRVISLPKILTQSCTSKIIPYINTSDKQQLRRLQGLDGYDLKLYPPLSGPGIARMITKYEKSLVEQNSFEKELSQKAAYKNNNNSDKIQVRSTFANEFGSDISNNTKTTSKSNLIIQSTEQNVIRTKVDHSNEDLNDEDNQDLQFEEKTRADQLREFQKGLLDLASSEEQIGSAKLASNDRKNVESMINQLKNQGHLKEKLSNEQGEKLVNSFSNSVQSEIMDCLQEPQGHTPSDDVNSTQTNIKDSVYQKTYCMVIQSSTWVGYLVVGTDLDIEQQDLEFILSKWIYENFGTSQDQTQDLINTSNLFLFQMSPVIFKEFSLATGQFTTEFEHLGKSLVLSFFSVDPIFIFLRLHEKFDMIKLDLSELPFEQTLEFDVNLYLPENEKFLMYSKKQSQIQKVHLDRLKEKQVSSVYTKYENEILLQKFRSQNIMNEKIVKFIKAQNR